MPSLQALGEFKASFSDLGEELKTLAELELPHDDLPLPDHEPAVDSGQAGPLDDFEPTASTDSSPTGPGPESAGQESGDDSGANFIDFGDLGDLLGGYDTSLPESGSPVDIETEDPADTASAQEEMDFGSFIDSIPDDFVPQEDSPNGEHIDNGTNGFEHSGPPTGLLNGLADEIEAERALLEEETEPETELPPFEEEALSAMEGGDDFEMNLDGLDSLDGIEDSASGELPELPEDEDGLSLMEEESLPEMDSSQIEENGFSASADDDFGLGEIAQDSPDDFGDLPDFGDSPEPDSPELDLPEFDSPESDSEEESLHDIDASQIEEAGLSVFAENDFGDSIDMGESDSSELDSSEFDLPEFDSGELDPGESLDMFAEEGELPISEEAAAEGEGPTDDSLEDFGDMPDFGDSGESDSEESLDMFAEEGELPISEEAAAEGEGPTDDSLEDFGDMPDFGDSSELDSGESGSGESLDMFEEDGLSASGGEDNVGTEEALAEASDDEEDGFDMGGEPQDFDTSAILEEVADDSFDNFKLDTDALSENFDLGSEEGSFDDEFGGLEDFSLPGVDDTFGRKTAPPKAGTVSQKAAGPVSKSVDRDSDDVAEISLTNEELERFQATLSSYPLNLRIACEELIAEQAVEPDKMFRLVQLLINGAAASETAALAGKILNKTIPIPKGFEKKTGEALEAEQASFAYIFVHNFLPVLRLFMMVAMVLFSVGFLSWRFIYTPMRAEGIYKLGMERIVQGEYSRANERFREAFAIHPKKSWFYEYARAFRNARQYILAEEKYLELLNFTASRNKRFIPEKAAVLEYAYMETYYIGDYQKADQILRRNILDFFPWDRDALLALGDNNLAWGEYDPSRLEDAREAYARHMERYGRSDPLLERMLLYFIRTDNLGEVISLQSYFMSSERRSISAATLAELGGYYLDKRFEVVRGVPNEFLDRIGGIREILLRAVRQDSLLPEAYYHLARYYNYFENFNDERLTLEFAVQVFDHVREESPKRIGYHITALRRYAELLIMGREFFPAEEYLMRAAGIYQDALSRRLLARSPEFGRLYADLGDLEYFVKDGNVRNALDFYSLAEQNGWAPPEMQYRMGSAHYQLSQWGPALERLSAAHRELPPNRRILYALGNASYMRGNYHAAQGYYDRLLEILNDDRDRLPPIRPTEDARELELAERLMVAQNNMGVTLEALTMRTGNNRYRSRAQALYSDSARAWDVLTRNPQTMIRLRPARDIDAPGVNPAFLNVRNNLNPIPDYEPIFFMRIDRDMFESSEWEELAPPGYRLSEGVDLGR